MSAFLLPCLFLLVAGCCLRKKVDFWEAFLSGAKEGLQSAGKILPALCLLMTALSMVQASGALDWISLMLKPFFDRIGFPSEVLPLALLRPFSGSGALAYYEKLCETVPADSFAGRVASVLMGGSETTFYTLAVYYGAVSVKNTRNTLFAALLADFAAAVLSVFAVRLFFPA